MDNANHIISHIPLYITAQERRDHWRVLGVI